MWLSNMLISDMDFLICALAKQQSEIAENSNHSQLALIIKGKRYQNTEVTSWSYSIKSAHEVSFIEWRRDETGSSADPRERLWYLRAIPA